ncbi:UNVERIFIED_CONTAM: hypothetical protein HDU68_011115 [Siphonaria sp. JEL0065]|nr:hypothetical protein HDU68_011115 [Siphonaria sp. JEL0065]
MRRDIAIFTDERLHEMMESHPEITEEEIQKLVTTLSEASNGVFIWITLVLGNVSGSDGFQVSEDEQLEILEEGLDELEEPILEHETGKMLIERLERSATLDLHALYCRALYKAYSNEQLVSEFKTTVGIILQVEEPITTDSTHKFISQFAEPRDKPAKSRVKKR